MRFLISRSSLKYKADTLNHGSYLPPIEVLKRKFSLADEKGKATSIIDEGNRPLMDTSAKLPHIPPMMTLPLMIMPPMPQRKVLNPQLQG